MNWIVFAIALVVYGIAMVLGVPDWIAAVVVAILAWDIP